MVDIVQKTVKDYIPIARSMTGPAFAARYDHPFLFGREVLEEEFQFNTLVTDRSLEQSQVQQNRTDIHRIRHWVIEVKKPAGAPGQDRIFLGRGETNDICLPHKTVSKLHAYLVRDPKITMRWFVVDTSSSNGTKTNGLRVPERAKVALLDGDTIAFGRCVFQWMSATSLYERLLVMSPSPTP